MKIKWEHASIYVIQECFLDLYFQLTSSNSNTFDSFPHSGKTFAELIIAFPTTFAPKGTLRMELMVIQFHFILMARNSYNMWYAKGSSCFGTVERKNTHI